MRDTGRYGLAIVRTSIPIVILLVLPGMFALAGRTRIGSELTHASQGPGPPPSPPYVGLLPDNLDFGDQVVRRTSAAKRITVQNTGGQPLNFDSVELVGDNPNSFAVPRTRVREQRSRRTMLAYLRSLLHHRARGDAMRV